MKIVFVTQNLAPFRVRWLDELSRYCQIKIYHLGHYEKSVNKKYQGYQPKRSCAEQIDKSILKIKLYDYKKILSEPCDLLIVDGYGFTAQVLLIMLLKIRRRKFILSVDGGFIPQSEAYIKAKLKRTLISSASAYLSTCKETDDLLAFYGADKSKIIRHHFSSVALSEIFIAPATQHEKETLRSELGLPNKATIISVGKWTKVKGFDILIESICDLPLDFNLCIVGGTPPEEYLKLCNKLGLSQSIFYIPFIEKEQLAKYYRASDLFVLATRGDVWGLVIGEAMACGLPIITTDRCIAGVAMLKEDANDCIVPANDTEAMKSAISSLMSNKDILAYLGMKNIKTISTYALEVSASEDFIHLERLIKEI